jgi:tetratricopeptide (TPR) repeat protein
MENKLVAITIGLLFGGGFLYVMCRELYGMLKAHFSAAAQGNRYLRQGKLEAAIASFTQLIEKQPEDIEAYLCRSSAYIRLNLLEQALEDCNTITELNLQNHYAYLNRGAIYGLRNEDEKCIAETTRCLELKPDLQDALSNRAYACYRTGQFDIALTDFNRLIELNPDSSDAYNGLAWLLATCPDESFRDGKRSLELATRNCELMMPPEWNDLGTLAAAHAATGSFDEAVRLAKESLTLAPEHEKADCQKRLALYERNEPYLDIVP